MLVSCAEGTNDCAEVNWVLLARLHRKLQLVVSSGLYDWGIARIKISQIDVRRCNILLVCDGIFDSVSELDVLDFLKIT